MRTLLLSAFCALSVGAMAGSLATAAPNNGSGGAFMELTAAGNDLTLTGFEFPLGGVDGTLANVEVWTRAGSYAGFTASNAGWTLVDTISATADADLATWEFAALNNTILLSANTTTSVYVHSITAGNQIRYTGTGANPPTTNYSNADLALFSDVARTGAVSFAGGEFTPRAFSGVVHYDVVPEPATMTLIGLGALAMLRRRKK